MYCGSVMSSLHMHIFCHVQNDDPGFDMDNLNMSERGEESGMSSGENYTMNIYMYKVHMVVYVHTCGK